MQELLNTLNTIKSIIEEKKSNKLLTLKDVCKYTNLSTSTIHRAIQVGQLKVSKNTGKLLFRREWVDTFLGV